MKATSSTTGLLIHTSFNFDEREAILEHWRALSKYFSIFNVDVTTDWRGLSSKPVVYMAITDRGSSGGVTFSKFPNTAAGILETESPWAWTTAAHEVGHSFGLSHTPNFNDLGLITATYGNQTGNPLSSSLMGGKSESNSSPRMPQWQMIPSTTLSGRSR